MVVTRLVTPCIIFGKFEPLNDLQQSEVQFVSNFTKFAKIPDSTPSPTQTLLPHMKLEK
jgi:hypothetical protein